MANLAAALRDTDFVVEAVLEDLPLKQKLFGEIERHVRLVMDFHVPRPGDVITGRPLLELTFEAMGPTQTRVTLIQSNFEALGEFGAPSRQGYNFVWTPIFAEGFGRACGR